MFAAGGEGAAGGRGILAGMEDRCSVLRFDWRTLLLPDTALRAKVWSGVSCNEYAMPTGIDASITVSAGASASCTEVYATAAVTAASTM